MLVQFVLDLPKPSIPNAEGLETIGTYDIGFVLLHLCGEVRENLFDLQKPVVSHGLGTVFSYIHDPPFQWLE